MKKEERAKQCGAEQRKLEQDQIQFYEEGEERESQNKVTFICDLYDGRLNSSLFLFSLVVS